MSSRSHMRILAVAAALILAATLYVVIDLLARQLDRPRSEPARADVPVVENEHARQPDRHGEDWTSSSENEPDTAPRAASAVTLEPKDLGDDMELSGRVLDPAGRPVQGAEVAWGWYDETTDHEGRFTLRYGQDMGSRLVATHPELTPGVYAPVEFKPNHALTRIVITLGEGGRIAGSVTNERGLPISGATVLIERAAPEPQAQAGGTDADDRFPPQSLFTEPGTFDQSWAEADGTYLSGVLVPGAYVVEVAVGEPMLAQSRTALVVAGETTSGVDIEVMGKSEVTGWLLDWDDNPISGARILLEEACETPKLPRRAISGPDGAFAFRAVEPGAYSLGEWTTGARVAPRRIDAPAEDVILRARPYIVLRGRVVDKETGDPIERFAVSSYDVPDDVEEHPDGGFEISVPAGDLTLYVNAPGYVLGFIDNVRIVEAIEPDDIVVELVRGTRLTFRVISQATGEPVAGAEVSMGGALVHSWWFYKLYGRVVTGADGVCSFEDFPSGRYEFYVWAKAYPEQCVLVEIAEQDQAKTVDVALRPGVVVRGRVVGEGTNEAVARAGLRLLASSRPPPQPPQTYVPTKQDAPLTEVNFRMSDKDGLFTFDCVFPGEYVLDVEPPRGPVPLPPAPDGSAQVLDAADTDYILHRQTLLVDDSLADEVVIELRRGGTIAGVVTRRDGSPAEAAEVYVVTVRRRWVETDAQGRYSISGLPEGEHTVEVDDGGSSTVRTAVVHLGETTQLDISLDGFAIFGVVTQDGAPRGRVSDGHDMWDVLVWARQIKSSSGRRPLVSHSATTDEQGNYRISCLEPGRYLLDVWCLALDDGQNHVAREVDVTDSDVRFDIEIGAGVVSGTVYLHNGWPAAEARIQLEPVSEGSERPWEVQHALFHKGRRDTTKDHGTFAIRGVLPGKYRVSVSAHGHAPHVAEVVMPPTGDVTGLVIELELEPTVIAQIKTWDSAVPSAVWVAVCNEEDHLVSVVETRTDTTTGECFIYGMRPGRHLVVAEATGYARACAAVDVADEGETRLTLTFERGSRRNILVVDLDGAPVHAADVLLDAGYEPKLEALLFDRGTVQQTSEGGAARFDHVADGAYTVRVRCDGYEDATLPVTIAGRDGALTITLKPTEEKRP